MTPPPDLKSELDEAHFEDVDNPGEWNSFFLSGVHSNYQEV